MWHNSARQGNAGSASRISCTDTVKDFLGVGAIQRQHPGGTPIVKVRYIIDALVKIIRFHQNQIIGHEILNSIGASQSVTDRERAQIALSYHCLSLLDVFWVKEENEKIRFEDINLFAHSLSNALVDIALRGHQMTVTNAHLLANDLSTGGLYPKAWVRKEDGFYLYKDGGREAVEREVLASKICRCFDCHQVLYEQGMFENEPVSISKIMTSQRYSLVTYAAYDVYCTNRDWNTLERS